MMDATLGIQRTGTEKLDLYPRDLIHTDPTTSSLHEVARLMESLHGLINEYQRQHSPELHSFAFNEVNLRGYTDEHNMLQAMITLEKRQGVEIGLD